jgi:hypothetical protein
MAGVGLQWPVASRAFKPLVTKKMRWGRHQLIEGKGGGARTTSISMRGRWPEALTAATHSRHHRSSGAVPVRLREGGRKVCGPLLGRLGQEFRYENRRKTNG